MAVELRCRIELDEVARLQSARPRDPVHGLVSDADADRAGKPIHETRR
jgi:hypothetical protein